MTRRLSAAAFSAAFAALSLAALPAAAQQVGNPAGAPPETAQAPSAMPGPQDSNTADRVFVHAATIGGMAEVSAGRLAGRKAASDQVKAFGRRMVEDHGKANARLKTLAGDAHLPQPDALDGDHRRQAAMLERLDGEAFDRAYLQGQIADHQATAQLLEWEIGSGENPGLQRFAEEILPVVLQHLQLAQALAAETTGQVAQLPSEEPPPQPPH